jgi:hypothetical protein
VAPFYLGFDCVAELLGSRKLLGGERAESG